MDVLDGVNRITVPCEIHQRQLYVGLEENARTVDLITRLDEWHRDHRILQPQMWVRLWVQLLRVPNDRSRERCRFQVGNPILQRLRVRRRRTEEWAEEDVRGG